MPARQQRASRDRRRIYGNAPARTATPWPSAATLQDVHTVDVTIGLDTIPPTGNSLPSQYTLQGIPQVYRVANGLYPTAAAIVTIDDAQLVRLTYGGANIVGGEEFIWGSQDPAVRTEEGGFIAQGRFTAV